MTDSHRHCMYCGISIPPKESFCSAKCGDYFAAQKQKAVKAQRLMIVVLALIFILAAYTNLR